MNIEVIETTSLTEKTEWGISFGGHNPEVEDYFKMPDEETAFRLKTKLDVVYTEGEENEKSN